eukprot:1075155-Rhodomonas_salina.3
MKALLTQLYFIPEFRALMLDWFNSDDPSSKVGLVGEMRAFFAYMQQLENYNGSVVRTTENTDAKSAPTFDYASTMRCPVLTTGLSWNQRVLLHAFGRTERQAQNDSNEVVNHGCLRSRSGVPGIDLARVWLYQLAGEGMLHGRRNKPGNNPIPPCFLPMCAIPCLILTQHVVPDHLQEGGGPYPCTRDVITGAHTNDATR